MIVDNDFNKWNINKLPRTKNSQGSGDASGIVTLTGGNREGTGYTELEGHYLWGQFFNGKQDINGDITTDGNVNFYGNLNFMGTYDPDDDLHGNLNIGNVNADNGHFKELNVDLLKAAEAYINNLTVTGSAHFFELIIDKIRSVGGAIMLTPGDGFELWGYSIGTTILGNNNIDLWWVKTDDRNGKYNKWVVGDQALCRSFDSAQVGSSSNVNNKYWWAKVIGVDTTGKWCTKLHADDYNPDEVMKLPEGNDNAYYTNTHSYLKKNDDPEKSDFKPSSNYVYVYIVPEIIDGETIYHRDRWITNEEYFALDDSVKSEYEYSQLYVYTREDGSTFEITELQYNNTDIKETDLLVYDDIARAGKILRSFCKADCKFCYNITISIASGNYATGSTFIVPEGSPQHYAYVFQEGDNIIMLGHQKQQTETEKEAANRQNAIYLNAGSASLDTDLRPPFFAQYKGINDFNLMSHRLTWFSGGSTTQGVYDNEIKGNLKIMSSDPNVDGENVQDYVNSQLIVAEDHITAEVTSNVEGVLNRTGIDIEDGTITLDADKTNVTGKLNIINENSGLVIYDGNKPVVSISNQTVSGASVGSSVQLIKGTEKHETTTTFTVSDIKTNMIKITAGSYTLSNMTLWATPNWWTDRTNAFPLSNVRLSLSLHKWSDDTMIGSYIYNNADFPVGGGAKYINIGGTNFDSSFTGNVYFKSSITFTFNSSQVLDGTINGVFTADLISSVNSATKIGNNGINILTDMTNNKYAQFTQNGYILSWDNQKVEMNSASVSGENILRRTVVHSDGDTAIGDIGSIIKCRIVTSQSELSLRTDDGFIVVKGTWGSSPELWFQDPANYKGRVVHIKNMSDKTILFKNSSSKLIEGKEVAADATNVIEDTIGCSTTFICDGEYWYQMNYLG